MPTRFIIIIISNTIIWNLINADPILPSVHALNVHLKIIIWEFWNWKDGELWRKVVFPMERIWRESKLCFWRSERGQRRTPMWPWYVRMVNRWRHTSWSYSPQVHSFSTSWRGTNIPTRWFTWRVSNLKTSQQWLTSFTMGRQMFSKKISIPF